MAEHIWIAPRANGGAWLWLPEDNDGQSHGTTISRRDLEQISEQVETALALSETHRPLEDQ